MKCFIKLSNSAKQGIEGSLTVEAAFVMPIVIFTIFSLIYLSFCLYDRCKIQGVLDMALHKAELSTKHASDFTTGAVDYEHINNRGVFYHIIDNKEQEEKEINGYLMKQLSKGLILYTITSSEIEVGTYSITLEVEAETKLRLPFFQELVRNYSKISVTCNGQIHNPAETIRYTEVILDTGSAIKGMDELKKRLESFLTGN